MTVLLATTVQSSGIKQLFESLRDILNETNLVFDADGMKIVTMDVHRHSLIHLHLAASKFDVYECAQPVVLGVNMLSIQKLTKTLTAHDIVSFRVDSPDALDFQLVFKNQDKFTETAYKIKTLDLDSEDITVPDVDMDAGLSLRAMDFQKSVRDMCHIASSVRIVATRGKLSMTCQGDFAERETTITRNDHGLVFHIEPQENEQVGGTYSLKYLNTFSKASNLSAFFDMFLKNDFPLIIRYPVVDLGELRLILAPETQDAEES